MFKNSAVIIACLLTLAFANKAGATEIVTASENFAEEIVLLDSLGSPTTLDSATDWMKFFVSEADGDSIFYDSLDIKQANAAIEIYRNAAADAWFVYKKTYGDIDGTAANQVYRWRIEARDSSLKLTTVKSGKFQMITQGNFANVVDSAAGGLMVSRSAPAADSLEALVLRARKSFDVGEVSTSSAAADSLESLMLRATKSVNVGQVSTSSAAADSAEAFWLRATKSVDAGSFSTSTASADSAESFFLRARKSVDAGEISTSSAAADSAEAFWLRANKVVGATVTDTPTVSIGKVDGDTVPANNLRLAFDLAMDSSVRLDLKQLRVHGSINDAITEASLSVRNPGVGSAGRFATVDTTGSYGLQIQTTGASAEALYLLTTGQSADGLRSATTGNDADAIQTTTTGSGSLYDWHATGAGVKFDGGFHVSGQTGSGFGFSIDNGLEIGTEILLNNLLGVDDIDPALPRNFADSLLNRKFKDYRGDVSPDTTIGYILAATYDSLDGNTYSATGSGGGGGCTACGSGAQVDSIRVVDTSGTDTYVALAEVRVYNSSGVFQNIWGTTNGDGYIVFQLATSTTYILGTSKGGHVFGNRTITTGSGASYRDSTMGYDVPIGSPASPQMARVYCYVKDASNVAIPNATVKFTPDQANAAVAGGSTTLLPIPIYSAPTDANGLTYVDLWWSSQVRYLSSDSTYKYGVGVLAPSDKAGGGITETVVRKRVTIPDSANYNLTLYLTP